MGRILTFVIFLTALAYTLTTVTVQHNESLAHDDTALQRSTLDNSISTALADLESQLQTSLRAGTTTLSSPPQTITNTLTPCATSSVNIYCNGTISYTATLASNDATNTQTQAVLSPTQRSHLNDNKGTDPNGNPIYNATTYRVHVGLEFNGKELLATNMDAELDIYDSYPIDVSLNTVRDDNSAFTPNSVGYADSYCNTASIGCSTVTAASDTTVVQAQTTCYDQAAASDPTLGDQCNPAGQVAATPHPHNNFETDAQADGTNSSSSTAP